MSENLIHDAEKAHAMALAGDENRTKAVIERQRIAAIKLAKLAYGDAADETERQKILNDVFREVGVSKPSRRPGGDRPDIVRGTRLADASSQEAIDLQRERQVRAFFEPSDDYETGLDGLADNQEQWAELIYGNPAVEYYKPKYPEINFENLWELEDQVHRAVDYYQSYAKYMPGYRESLEEGKYVVGALHQFLFENRYSEVEFVPNTELLELLQDDSTTVGQLREFVLRQEELSEEEAKREAEELTLMLDDVKNRRVSLVTEN